MTFKWLLVASAALALAGCTHRRNAPYEEPRTVDLGPIAGGVVGQTIARGSAAPGAPGPREFFDERAGRYYYYDERTGRTVWEDGRPRS